MKVSFTVPKLFSMINDTQFFLDEETNNFLWRLDENGLLFNKKVKTSWKYGSRKWTFEEGGRIVLKDGKKLTFLF